MQRCLAYEQAGIKRPWISQSTLDLLMERDQVRTCGSPDKETDLTKRIRASVKKDKQRWLDDKLAGGSWAAARGHRKGLAKKPVQIRDAAGHLVESSVRADTMADYFEHFFPVQTSS